MQTFEHDTNCAEIIIQSYHVKVSQTFNQLLTLSLNLLKISSFNLHTGSQMRVPLVNDGRVLYVAEEQHSHTHTDHDTVLFLEQVTSQFISPDQTALAPTQWTTVSVACLPVMCVQNVNELKQHLLNVWYVVEHNIIGSAVNKWCMSLQACLRSKEEILSKCCHKITLLTG